MNSSDEEPDESTCLMSSESISRLCDDNNDMMDDSVSVKCFALFIFMCVGMYSSQLSEGYKYYCESLIYVLVVVT